MIAPWYVMAYTQLDRIACRYGYALALHGSMTRDLDLIAVPWTQDAEPPDELLQAIKDFILDRTGTKIAYQLPMPVKKPHGRLAYSFPIGYDGHYLDVSIMPRSNKRVQPTAPVAKHNGRKSSSRKSSKVRGG